MYINFYPRNHNLYGEIKKRIINLLKTNPKLQKNPFSLKIYILKNSKLFSWSPDSIHKIEKSNKIGRDCFKRIERYSNQDEFREYLHKFKQGQTKYRYISLCKDGIIFISGNNGRKDIVYFTYERDNNLNKKNKEVWVRYVVDTAFYICVKALYFNSYDGVLLLHAAGIKKDAVGCLFLGESRSGKSTICSLSEGFRILHDDLIVVEPDRQRKGFKIYAFDDPLCKAKLKYIFFIQKHKEHRLELMTANSAFKEGFVSILDFRKYYFPDFSHKKIDLSMAMFRHVPSYKLYFKKDPSFWRLIENLNGNGNSCKRRRT